MAVFGRHRLPGKGATPNFAVASLRHMSQLLSSVCSVYIPCFHVLPLRSGGRLEDSHTAFE